MEVIDLKILGIETTAKVSSAAIMDNNNIISEFNLNVGLTHSQTIMPIINNVLDMSGNKLEDIDVFAVTTGPGSFTGVRIGVSLVKGLSLPRDTKCIGISSLESLAYNLYGFEGYICSAMDARRSQVYSALFEFKDNNMCRIFSDDILKIEQLGEKIKDLDKPLLFVGDGAELCYSNLKNINNKFSLAPLQLRYQKAASCCIVAKKLIQEDSFNLISAQSISPCYLRPSQAEREYASRNCKSQ